jgi:hypothetical protein
VLRDVDEAALLRMKAPHAEDRVVPAILALIGPPRMVHVHRGDAALERKAIQ